MVYLEGLPCFKCGELMPPTNKTSICHRCATTEPKPALPRVWSVMHFSTNGLAAGKNYRMFLKFLEDFIKSGYEIGKIEFTYTEIEKLKEQHKEELAAKDALLEEAERVISTLPFMDVDPACDKLRVFLTKLRARKERK